VATGVSRGRSRRWVLIGGGTLVAVAAASVWWLNRPATAEAAPTTRTVAATVGTMRMTTSTSGTLAPAQQANLGFAVSGQVTAVYASVGQKVVAGQKLAAVTSAGLRSQVAQAKAQLAQARVRLSSDAGASSAQRTADTASVTAAQSALDDATANLASATLTSPIAGTVAQVDLAVGQQVAASGGSGSGPSGAGGSAASGGGGTSGGGTGGTSSGASSAQVVVIGDAFVVDATVDGTQIGLIRKGAQAVVLPQGATTPQYGTVTSVGLLGTATSGVTSFPVVVTVTGRPAGLYAGATAALTIVYRQLNDVLQVPTAAVHYGGGSPYVEVPAGSGTARRTVSVGATSGGATQITSGLDEGQQVVVTVTRTAPGRSGPGGQTGTRGGFGGGGFGGGGFGGGGFGGGGGGLDGDGGGRGQGR
jgi:membrane fusion protein, macrolide-specific efflux system